MFIDKIDISSASDH